MPSKGACSSPDQPSTPDRADVSWAASCLRNSADGDDEDGDNNDPIYPADSAYSILRPDEIIETLLSAEFEPQPDETEISSVSPFRNPLVPGTPEFPTWSYLDAESPNSAMAAGGEAEDEGNIFPVWDLNTENLELESGTLTEILTSSLDGNSSRDSRELFNSTSPPSSDAFDLRDLDSALEDCQDVDSLIADMAGLKISVSGKQRNR